MTGLRRFLFAGLMVRSLCGGSLEGRVTNSVTGAGIQGVGVTARRGLTVGGWSITDVDGRFTIDDLEDGEYSVAAAGAKAVVVKVADRTRFDIQISSGASVRGRVLDPDGKPAEDVIVNLGKSRAVTDESGEFLLEEVKPGIYGLTATPPDAATKDGQKVVAAEYPQKLRVENTDLSGYTLRLQRIHVHTIHGMVEPAAAAEVQLLKRSTRAPIWVYGPAGAMEAQQDQQEGAPVKTSENGTFEVKDVPEGDWLVRATLSERDPETNVKTSLREGSAEVHVGTADADGVKIRMAERFRLEIAPEAGDADAKIFQRLAVAIPLDGGMGFPGRYWIMPQAAPGFYMSAAMLDGRDVKGQVVEIGAPAVIRAVYRTDGGGVHGVVEHGSGAVVVLRADAANGSRIGYSARCDDAGSFTIRDVAPGGYSIAVLRDADRVSAEVLDQLEGESVRVEVGSVATMELK